MTRYATTRSLIRSNAEFPNGLTVSNATYSSRMLGQILQHHVQRGG